MIINTAMTRDIGAIQDMATLWRQNCTDSSYGGLELNPRRHILRLISNFKAYECSDPRDRIIALHSISRGLNAGVVVDYTLDVQTTYRNFAFACMANEHTDTILKATLAQLSRKAPFTWPSWVPDWRLNGVEDTGTWDFYRNVLFVTCTMT
jgi:hypothetical protein